MMIDMYKELFLNPSDSVERKTKILLSHTTLAKLGFHLDWINSFADMVGLECESDAQLARDIEHALLDIDTEDRTLAQNWLIFVIMSKLEAQ